MKKRLIAGVGALSLAVLGFAMPTSFAAADDSKCADAAVLCIGVVTDIGHVDDKSFNQAAWEGAQAGAKAAGGVANYIESSAATDAEYGKNIKLFADKKYDVIVTVGFLEANATVAAAKQYPDIKFIGVDQFVSDAPANLAGLNFHEDQAGFVAGYLAGYLTKTGKTGAVVGLNIPPVYRFAVGFQNGVAYAAAEQGKKFPASKLIYHPAADNAFNDPAFGASNSAQLLSQGYDVIFAAGGGTGNGGLTRIAKAKGKFCIGVDVDQWNTVKEARPCLVTSAMKNIAKGVSDQVALVKSGKFASGNVYGTTSIAPYHALSKRVPAAVQKKVAKVQKDVVAGIIKTGVK
jgi:basic membrane protein A